MELVKKVSIEFANNNILYYVFKLAAEDGWMLGVVGPYFDDSKPYYFAGAPLADS